MADAKISDLSSGAPAVATDVTVIARAGANYKLALSDVWTLPSASQLNWTDTGLARSAAGVVKATDGSSGNGSFYSAATYGFLVSTVGASGAGMGPSGGGGIVFRNDNGFATSRAIFSALVGGGLQVGSTDQYGFSSAGVNAASNDTGLARSAAGVVKVTDGSTGLGSLVIAVGSKTAPSLLMGANGIGLESRAAGHIGFAYGGSEYLMVYPAGGSITAASGANIGWASGTDTATTSIDTGFARNAVAEVRVTDGSTGYAAAVAGQFKAGSAVANYAQLNSSGLRLGGGYSVLWSGTASDSNAALDTGLARSAAGIVKVTDGSTGYGAIIGGKSGGGSATATSFRFDTTAAAHLGGFYAAGDNQIIVATDNNPIMNWVNNASINMTNTYGLNWASGSCAATSPDTGLARSSAGVLKVTNGSTGAGQLTLEAAGESRIATGKVTLTEAGGVETVAVVTTASSNMTGGEFMYTVRATDGTDLAARTGRLLFQIIDAAGTVTANIATVTDETNDGSSLISTSSKTLTYAISKDVSTAHKFKITFNIDSDMVVNAASITWTMVLNGPGTVSTS